MFECHRFEEFEKTVPAEQSDPDSIKRIHKASVAVEVVPTFPHHHEYLHRMEIANVVPDASRRLHLPFSDGYANPLTELSRKHAVIGPRINHAGEHEIKLTALVVEQGVDLRARNRCLLRERRRRLARRRCIGNNYRGGCRSRQSRSLDEHKADALVRNPNEKRTPFFEFSGSSEGLVKALSVAEYPLLILRQSHPLTLVGFE